MAKKFVHGSSQAERTKPSPAAVSRWVAANIALVERDFARFADEGKYFLTQGEVEGAAAGDADLVHPAATLALAAYNMLRRSPVERVDTPSLHGDYTRRFLPCAAGWAGFSPEDWHRCVVLTFYFIHRRDGKGQILNAKGPPNQIFTVGYREQD